MSKANGISANLANANPFMAMSPPSYSSNTSHPFTSPLAEAAHQHVDKLTEATNMQKTPEAQAHSNTPSKSETIAAPRKASLSTNREEQAEKGYISKVGILTSSLPVYHNAFMAAKKKDQGSWRLPEQGESLEPLETQTPSRMNLDDPPGVKSSEEQAETIRRLKPHSRSTIQLMSITAKSPPEDTDSRAKPRHKNTRWQFGIRSRNEPIDAIRCLYKALESMGDCQWHISPPKEKFHIDNAHQAGPFPVSVQGATHLQSKLSESPEKTKHNGHGDTDYKPQPKPHRRHSSRNGFHTGPDEDQDSESENDDDIDPDLRPEDYATKDPWCIHVRWEKKGMSPPGTTASSSARSSRIDLSGSDGGQGRRRSILGSLASATNSATSIPGTGSARANSCTALDDLNTGIDGTACFVYMDLQIYLLEQDTYLVDFKSAGYENVVGEREVRETTTSTAGGGAGVKLGSGAVRMESIGEGVRRGDKDVSSCQPFMDLANKLVIHLAKGSH